MEKFRMWSDKMLKLTLFLSLILPITSLAQSPTSAKRRDDFDRFYASFRVAVRKRDRAALTDLMSPKFQWAMDGSVSRDQAIGNISKIIGWEKFWQSAIKAVAPAAERCQKSYCEGRPGYHVFTKSPFPLEMMFEKDARGNWHWSAVLGD
jgi:hypothetical protein